MVVEDHPFQRRVAIQLLRSMGVTTILEAGDGRDALACLEGLEDTVDVVFSDLDMPGMDGIEFLRNVAERRLAKAVAITSGLEEAMLRTVESMAKAYGVQVLGTVAKPITVEHLGVLLDRYEGHDDLARDGLPGPLDRSLDRATLLAALRNDEIVALFQPKIDLASGTPAGVEALVRWRMSAGSVGPSVVVPAFQDAGLLEALTDEILLQGCRALCHWEEEGLGLSMSVNVSMTSLEHVERADEWHEIVRSLGLDPRRLIFEVTETDVMTDAARSLDVLGRLRLKGFGLSIDDFGTGYSSLLQLSTIPFTELKVDRSFVSGVESDARRRTVLELSIDLARKLNLRSVAEGVETVADWRLVESLGCTEAQGLLIAAPMAVEEIVAWVRAWLPPERPV